MNKSMIPTEDLIEELILRSSGCVIGFVGKGHPSVAETEFKYGNANPRELIGLCALLTESIVHYVYEEDEFEKEEDDE
jgi:hypothetical protein